MITGYKNPKEQLPLPPSTNHAYHTNKGKWYKDESVTIWEDGCIYKLKKAKWHFYNLPTICVHIAFYFGDNRRRDIDGKIKFVLDMLQKAGAYKDDNLVTDLIVSKRIDKKNPRLEIDVY